MTLLPLGALLVFAGLDLAADRRWLPARTVSELVWAGGWPLRMAAGAAMLALFSHLVFQWPDGPVQ